MSGHEKDVNRRDGFALGRVYSRDDLMFIMGIGEETFRVLEAEGGLERIQPTLKIFYSGDDVLEAMRKVTREK